MSTNDLHFVNNIALLIERSNELQTMVNRVIKVSKNFSWKVNIENTEIQYMGRLHKDFNIVKNNQNFRQ